MASARLAVLIAASLGFAAAPVGADEAGDVVGGLQALLGGVTGSLLDAAGRLAAADRSGAGDALVSAASKAASLEAQTGNPGIAGPLGVGADRVAKAASALRRAVARTSVVAADPRRSDAVVLRALKKANARQVAIESAFRRAPTAGPVVVLEEVRARSAGFYRPGQPVVFRPRVHPRGACPSPMSVTVFDTAASLGKVSVLGAGLRSVSAEEPFTVVMGPDAGAARVVLSGCGRTSVRLLYNHGPKPGGGAVVPVDEDWDFALAGSDEFVLGGLPYPSYTESWSAAITFHGDLVAALGGPSPNPTGAGLWSGVETPLLQQPEPAVVHLLGFEAEVPVVLEALWSPTTPTLHLRSESTMIAHRFLRISTGLEESAPVQTVRLDIGASAPGALSGTWNAVGAESESGNSSSGTWTATKR